MKAHAALPVRILTHNIRYATHSPFPGEKPWAERKDLIVNELRYNTAHIPEAFICLQEVLHEQLVDILAGLNSAPSAQTKVSENDNDRDKDQWAYIGVGRDDGHHAGEYSPILYRPAVWSVSRWSTVWLSPTPTRPSKGWDAGSIRIVSVGHFTHVASRKRVVGLCTHFDEQGEVSRAESARIVQGIVEDVSVSGEGRTAAWLAGDLNSEMHGAAYQLLNGDSSRITDARRVARWRYGDQRTCTGFRDEEMTVIDYVFVGRKGWEVQGFSVLPNRFEDGVYCSDHRAVVVDVLLEI